MRRVAIATFRGLPGGYPDEERFVDALREGGCEVTPVVWDDPDADWDGCDDIVVRSTWDYMFRVQEFRAWLERLEGVAGRVHNPVELMRWNLDKRYLNEIAERAPIVPTHWTGLEGLDGALRRWRERGWDRVVVKPVIAANALGATVVPMAEAEAAVEAAAGQAEVMVQPFLPEIIDDGEWSFIFIGGEFCDAVRKRPRAGDYRVQETHGGSTERADAPEGLLGQARRVVEVAAPGSSYARVDGVDVDGSFLLMELELIEPTLYMAHCPDVAPRLAEVILRERGNG